MADDAGNAATFSFGGTTQGKVTSISFSQNGNEIDVTAFGDTAHEYLLGIPDTECSVELIGVTALTLGASGAVAVAWADSGTSTSAITSAIITSIEKSDSLDGPVTSSLTLKPYGG